MRALVTGGAGFIGSTLVDRLIGEGYDVFIVDDFSSGREENLTHALSSNRAFVNEMDVRAPGLASVFADARPDIVFHLAAQIDVRVSVADPALDADVNILGTLNVLEQARHVGVRKVLVASSGGCIYGEPKVLPVRESARSRPESPYGISKRVLNDYLRFYRRAHGLQHAVMALSNVYGPRQDPRGEAGVVAIFLRAMLARDTTTIFGDGTQTRDFVFVEDVVDAFMRGTERGSGVFNIGTGRQISVLELWRACAAVARYEREPGFAPARIGELQHSALESARADKYLGWQARTELDEGLDRTADYVATVSGIKRDTGKR